ncbi:MAG: restriction endonuclease subunit S [Oscillospiraceae bacterium]|nr:restriction endonuclease subunit S [Oscillospiraceae bacterium]
MTPQELKNSVLQQAFQGKLVGQRPEEGTGKELFLQIQEAKAALIAKKEKALPQITEDDWRFDIPDTWHWCYIGDLFQHNTGKALNGTNRDGAILQYITTSNLYWNRFELDRLKEMPFTDAEIEKCTIQKGDLLVCEGGDCGRAAIWSYDMPMRIQNHIHRLRPYGNVSIEYFYYIFYLYKNAGWIAGKGIGIQGLSSNALHSIVVPLPPLAEQKRIVARLEEILPLIDRYEAAWNKLEAFNKRFPMDMQKSILQMAMQGKCVEQDANEGSQRNLFKQVQEEYQRNKPLPAISEDEIPYDIPDSWFWVRLGDALIIERGGSPRPIKEYITSDPNGINWIKIGDTEKGGKYINATQERIVPAGMKKSRYVKKGDFLLSNSMSFGRPYILNIDGCIHDGWLVLRPVLELFDKDYLYYLLSSPMVFAQFCSRVAGAVVNNLNSDKVALTVVPVPPLAEQKRIVAKLEEILPLCDRLK